MLDAMELVGWRTAAEIEAESREQESAEYADRLIEMEVEG